MWLLGPTPVKSNSRTTLELTENYVSQKNCVEIRAGTHFPYQIKQGLQADLNLASYMYFLVVLSKTGLLGLVRDHRFIT